MDIAIILLVIYAVGAIVVAWILARLDLFYDEDDRLIVTVMWPIAMPCWLFIQLCMLVLGAVINHALRARERAEKKKSL